MNQLISVLQIITPIFTAVVLGIYARRKAVLSPEHMQGLQQFVMKFALPCVLFNSCYSADLGAESVTSMVLVLPLLLLSCAGSFQVRKRLACHNLPMLFSAQESGMLGIPLFITLFGLEHAYRLGVMDVAQSFVAIPVIAILASDAGRSPSPGEILKKVFRSPLLLMGLLGLALNLSGLTNWLNQVGLGSVITETTSFISQPVSAAMLFSVGYNFSISSGNRSIILRVAGAHFALFSLFCMIMQGILFLTPAVDPETRWAVFLYCMLPSSYLSPSLGRSEEDHALASGVCSILTVVCLLIFCAMTVLVS